MSKLTVNQPPPVRFEFKWTVVQLEHMWRSIMDYNLRRMAMGDSPLTPDHPMVRIQSEIHIALDPMIAEGMKEGWDISILLKMKTEINDAIEAAEEDADV